jgi:hypothetical protein
MVVKSRVITTIVAATMVIVDLQYVWDKNNKNDEADLNAIH